MVQCTRRASSVSKATKTAQHEETARSAAAVEKTFCGASFCDLASAMKQRPSAAFWASAARVSVRQVWSCAASGSGRSVSARKDHVWSRGEGEW